MLSSSVKIPKERMDGKGCEDCMDAPHLCQGRTSSYYKVLISFNFLRLRIIILT